MGLNKGKTAPVLDMTGQLSVIKVKKPPSPLTVDEIQYHSFPRRGLSKFVNQYRKNNLSNILRGFDKIEVAKHYGIPTMYGTLGATIIHNGEAIDLGIVSTRVVTTAGATKIVDFLRNNDTSTGASFKYHGLGTGTTSEAAGDTTLVTELTTEYVGNTRATGTQTNNGATVYQSVGTVTLDSGNPVIREHGIFSAASSGTLLDRSVFSAITLDGTAGDALQVTYALTISAGG